MSRESLVVDTTTQNSEPKTQDSKPKTVTMSNEELKQELLNLHPSLVFEEGGEWLNMFVEPQEWLPFAQQLRSKGNLFFNYLFCLTCIDWKTHLTMVYHFRL